MKENKVPTCVGIILDGNRRWAVAHGLPKLEGHQRGYDRVKECAYWVRDRGIQHLAVYVFSTENWNREAEEVSYLMSLLLQMAARDLETLVRDGMRVRFIGMRERLSTELCKAIEHIEAESAVNTGFTLWICLSYGARLEITEAAKTAALSGAPITEESLRTHLWSAEMPDPDLIIRTSGEQRLSNFLLWQAAYSELFFIKPHWPDFSEKILDDVLQEYAERERRMGK